MVHDIIQIKSEHDVIGKGHVIVIDTIANYINVRIRVGDFLKTAFSTYEVRGVETMTGSTLVGCITELI